jgi:hypothetical protein
MTGCGSIACLWTGQRVSLSAALTSPTLNVPSKPADVLGMVRLRWGVAALATVLVAVVGLFTFTHRSTTPDLASFGSGSQNASDLAAARAMVVGLATPAGTTRDPYATACHSAATVCLSSALPTQTLLATTTEQLKAAGATVLTHSCPAHSEASCSALFDFHAVHISALAGHDGGPPPGATYLALRVDLLTQGADVLPTPSKALGSWASVNPLPPAWHLTATCTKPSAAACNAYRSDTKNPLPIATGLTQAFAAAKDSLTAAGFRIDQAACLPDTSGKLSHCLVAGARFRTLGGHDGELAVVALKAMDAGHVTAFVDVSALS